MTTKKNAKPPQKPVTREQVEAGRKDLYQALDEAKKKRTQAQTQVATTTSATESWIALHACKQREESIYEAIRLCDAQLANFDRLGKKATEEALAESRQAEIDSLKEHPPNCTECGYPGVLVEGNTKPTFVAGRGLGDPGARYCLYFVCRNEDLFHGKHRFTVWLPEPKKAEKTSD